MNWKTKSAMKKNVICVNHDVVTVIDLYRYLNPYAFAINGDQPSTAMGHQGCGSVLVTTLGFGAVRHQKQLPNTVPASSVALSY